MRRREFLSLSVGGLAVAAASDVRGQQPAKPPVIGLLATGTQTTHGAWVAAFAQRLAELGWTDGRNVRIEYRWAAGDAQKAAEFAAEFVQRKVEVIVTSAFGVVAASKATSTIPIVFAAFSDPVASGLAATLARPGGNVTGLTVQPSDLSSKRLDLLREIVPGARRIAMMINKRSASPVELTSFRSAATSFQIEPLVLEVSTADDIDSALATLRDRTDALYVYSEPLTNANRERIIKAATAAAIPTVFGFREFVDAGGLLSYGANFSDLFSRAADFTDKILRGARPAEMPVQQPIKFDLVVNLRTAKALGLRISESFLTRADEVIE